MASHSICALLIQTRNRLPRIEIFGEIPVCVGELIACNQKPVTFAQIPSFPTPFVPRDPQVDLPDSMSSVMDTT
jgi:hypothetical protein